MKLSDDKRCVAINLSGTRCGCPSRLEELCVMHYNKKVRYKVETVR
jgi:hypothetical protein